MKKILKSLSVATLSLALNSAGAFAGTVTISATGLSGAPIFVTSTLGSISVGTELRIGTFNNTSALQNIINTYKAGVVGTGLTLAEAQADGASKKSLLYSDTVSWLSSASNFSNFVAAASSVSQTGTSASGKLLFNNSFTRTVDGVPGGSYGGANGTFAVTYSTYAPGVNARLWAWFATGSEIAIVTDALWVVPGNDAAGLTISTVDLADSGSGSGSATELLLANYTNYATNPDLISSVAAPVTLEVVPEPSTGALMMIGAAGLVALRRLRKV